MWGPREKLLQFGAASLNDEELLAILLRTGVKGSSLHSPISVLDFAHLLIEKFGNLRNVFVASFEELSGVLGLGKAKTTTLLAMREIAYRLNNHSSHPRLTITSPEVAYRFFGDIVYESQEVLVAGFLNHHNQVLKRSQIFRGTINTSVANPREILREALRANAAKILVAHNHPSQNPDPSPEDEAFTKRLEMAAALVGIPLVDHLIVCEGKQYYSFATQKQLTRDKNELEPY